MYGLSVSIIHSYRFFRVVWACSLLPRSRKRLNFSEEKPGTFPFLL